MLETDWGLEEPKLWQGTCPGCGGHISFRGSWTGVDEPCVNCPMCGETVPVRKAVAS